MITDTVLENTISVINAKNNYKEYGTEYNIEQKPYVDENGIYVPVNGYIYRCVMTKEIFVEAYNKYIGKSKRRYKGGWKR